MSYCPFNHKIECIPGIGCKGCIHEVKPINTQMVKEVSPEFDEILCNHGNDTDYTKVIPLSKTSLPPTLVALTNQLQLDGSYKKIGICPRCGRIYVVSNININLKLKEEE